MGLGATVCYPTPLGSSPDSSDSLCDRPSVTKRCDRAEHTRVAGVNEHKTHTCALCAAASGLLCAVLLLVLPRFVLASLLPTLGPNPSVRCLRFRHHYVQGCSLRPVARSGY